MQTIRGVIIHHIRYTDQSFIVRVFCEHHGMKAFLVRAGKKTGKNLLQPLTLIEFEASIRENVQLQTLKNLRISHPLHHIHFDPVKSAMVMFLDELLYKTIPDDYVNNGLFSFLHHGTILLDDAIDPRNFHIWFMLEISRYYGFYPTYSSDAPMHCLDIATGTFLSNDLPGSHTISGETAETLFRMMDLEWPQVQTMHLHSSLRKSLLQALVGYILFHLEMNKEIKSIQVLHEVFHD
jgi:DNA repair protein RecO (recombination protein O)